MADSAQASARTFNGDSVALNRLVAEVRGPEPMESRAHYNRTHNRHNR